jgi:hypothetical protein
MPDVVADDLLQTGNYLEAGLWMVIAATFALWAARRPGAIRRRCVVAAAAFFLFGLSDVVEVHTGAWWRPWWLLVWKASCVLAFAWLLWDHVRDRRKVT